MSDAPKPRSITKLTLALWALPVLVGCVVLALAYALNWEPWFGFASIIAGALLTMMLVGNHYNVGPDG